MNHLARHLLGAAFAIALSSPLHASSRIVAVGDIHGEYEGMTAVLRAAGLLDGRMRWAGGSATLVQTGDMLDRGPDVRKVMDLLMDLERQATRRRGRVIVLLGNHELMNMTGAMRDVSPAAYASFADRRSEKRRQVAYKEYVALQMRRIARHPASRIEIMPEQEWMEKHPVGLIEYHAALGPDGKYGRWLRSRDVVHQIGDTVFLHGGISPDARAKTLPEINRHARLELTAFDRIKSYLISERLILPFFSLAQMTEIVEEEMRAIDPASIVEGREPDIVRAGRVFLGVWDWSIYDAHGPLWYRGFAEWSDEEGEKILPLLLEEVGTKRFVVGHSVTELRRILPRFGGRVFLIDTAMVRYPGYNGRASALEIREHGVTAIYEDGRVALDAASRTDAEPRSPNAVLMQGETFRLDRRPGIERAVDAGGVEKIAQNVRPVVVLASFRDEPESSGGESPSRWIGQGGAPLPFASASEVASFLSGAKLVSVDRKRLGGATKPRRVLVENGGVRARAVFRSFHREAENAHWESGWFTEYLRDSYKTEIAAYELGLLLGMDNIPPTVPWRLKREQGALQLWMEKTKTGWDVRADEEVDAPDKERWKKQVETMHLFDALVRNADRHPGNMLVDADWKLWLIDHSRTFGREKNLEHSEPVVRCGRRLFESLRRLDRALVTERLSPYIGPLEIEALFIRRDLIIDLLEGRIQEHGEEAVLFDEQTAVLLLEKAS
jgi:hypothetical protein